MSSSQPGKTIHGDLALHTCIQQEDIDECIFCPHDEISGGEVILGERGNRGPLLWILNEAIDMEFESLRTRSHHA